MPNWCNNSIDINGPTDKIKDLFEKAGQEDSGLLQAMVPMPSELNDTQAPSDGLNWYDWRVSNWGTKWDVGLEGLDLHDNGDGTSTISGWFDSAWSPPIDAYNTFLENNEDCSISALYEEGGMDFAGSYENGEDEFLDGISDYARTSYLNDYGSSGCDLYDRLDSELGLTESRAEYIQEELEEAKETEESA